jgi:hypothetical protein
MKKLKVEYYEVVLGEGIPADTMNLIEFCMDQPPQGGFKRKDFVELDRIQNSIDKCRVDKSDSIEFDDSDVVVLKKVIDRSSFFTRHKDVKHFLDSVMSL